MALPSPSMPWARPPTPCSRATPRTCRAGWTIACRTMPARSANPPSPCATAWRPCTGPRTRWPRRCRSSSPTPGSRRTISTIATTRRSEMRLIPSVRLLLVPALFGLATLPALADDDCKHSRPMSLDPDLSGVDKVRFEIGPHELDLRGVEDNASVEAIACVSDTRYFDQLRLSQERRGDTLVIIAKREERGWEINFGRTYATLKVSARLPAGLDYEVDIGS